MMDLCLVILFASFFANGDSQTCTSSDDLGNSNYNGLTGNMDSSSDTQFVMTDNEYYSPCCGVVTSWNIYAGNTGSIVFQVFRENGGGSSAVLIGENAVTVSNSNQFVYNVPTSDQIQIQKDDLIGWYSGTNAIVEYKAGGSRNDNNYIEDISQPSIGDTVSYNTRQTDRTYAFYATLDALAAPTLTNLDDTVNQFASLVSSATLMFTVTSSSGSPTYSLQNINPSSHFAIDSSTGEVTATTSSVSATTYTLTISVAESCSDSSTGTLTIVLADTQPVWSNMDASVTVSKGDVSTSSATFTAVATNPDLGGAVTYSLQTISPSSHFSVDPSTGDVTATTSQVDATTFALVIRASDDYGNYVDGTLSITVVNRPPEITSLPDVAYISEAAVDETLLHVVNVTDPDGDLITCDITPSPAGPFVVKFLNVDGVFTSGIYLQASPSLDYSVTNAYEISVTCSDGTVDDTDILYIYLTANNVPQITNLPNTTSILSSTPSYTIMFTVLATDVEGDKTYFDVSCLVASPCPFTIYSEGSVVLTTSLVSTAINGYELDISVRDDYSSSGTHRLVVFVTDLNTQPQLSNLPATIQVPEDTAVGTTVFQARVYDEDGDTSHTFSCSFSPASSSVLFEINSTSGVISLKTALNYLTQTNSYTLDIAASDGQVSSNISSLTIQVVDVNQAPVLYQTNYQVNVDEGPAGTEAPDPGFNSYDPDGDQLLHSWGGGNDTSGFSINTTNGIVSFTIDFDADDDATQTYYVWLVVISDPDGLSTTATLTLSILDTNDNVPSFASSNYATIVLRDANPGTSIITAPSTDADRWEVNRELQYSIHSTNLFIVDHSGTVFVYEDLTDLVGTTEYLWLRVRNPGVSDYDSCYIAVSIVEGDSDGFFDNPANIAWVTLAAVFGTLLLIGLAYLGYLGYQKWMAAPAASNPVTQVAPMDTKPPPYTPPYTPPKSRVSLITRGTPVTPTDVRVDGGWEGWKASNWLP